MMILRAAVSSQRRRHTEGLSASRPQQQHVLHAAAEATHVSMLSMISIASGCPAWVIREKQIVMIVLNYLLLSRLFKSVLRESRSV